MPKYEADDTWNRIDDLILRLKSEPNATLTGYVDDSPTGLDSVAINKGLGCEAIVSKRDPDDPHHYEVTFLHPGRRPPYNLTLRAWHGLTPDSPKLARIVEYLRAWQDWRVAKLSAGKRKSVVEASRHSKDDNLKALDKKARALARSDDLFVNGTKDDWASKLECGAGLVPELPFWREHMAKSGRGRKKKKRAVAFTKKLEALVGATDPDIDDDLDSPSPGMCHLTNEQRTILKLTEEQQAEDEGSPLDPDGQNAYSDRRL